MIAILINHYERFFQLNRTLKSIFKTEFKDFKVIVLDHDSPSFSSKIIEFEKQYPEVLFLNKPKPDSKNWYSSIVSYNWGIRFVLKYLNPDIIMIQDAECYHIGDVILAASKVGKKEYISFGAFSTNEETMLREDFENVIEGMALSCTEDVLSGNGQNAWYNHYKLRGVGYGFCCAMTSDNMKKINGFDERYMEGVAYGDDDFVNRIKKCMEIIIPEYPFVIHQWHYDVNYNIDYELLNKNKELYSILRNEEGFKAKHIITEDF